MPARVAGRRDRWQQQLALGSAALCLHTLIRMKGRPNSSNASAMAAPERSTSASSDSTGPGAVKFGR